MTDVLRVQDLRQVCGMLLDAVEERFGAEIDLSGVGVDLYWNVDLRAAFELRDDPAPGIDVGQSSDDIAELRALLGRPVGDVPVLPRSGPCRHLSSSETAGCRLVGLHLMRYGLRSVDPLRLRLDDHGTVRTIRPVSSGLGAAADVPGEGCLAVVVDP
ncbi:MAG: hypothetical protein WA890_17400 [Micromonospora sp.]